MAHRKTLWSSLCSIKLTTTKITPTLMEKGGWILSADNLLPNRPLKMPMSQLQLLPALVSSHKDKGSYNFGRVASFNDSFPKAPQPSSCYRYCHIPGNQWEKKRTTKTREPPIFEPPPAPLHVSREAPLSCFQSSCLSFQAAFLEYHLDLCNSVAFICDVYIH